MSRPHVSSNFLSQVRPLGPRARRLGTLAGVLLIVGLGAAVPTAVAAPADTVDLGSASSYAVLSGASVGNVVSADGAPHTTLRGDLGVKANAQPTGFPPGVVTGTKNIGNGAAAQAHSHLVAAHTEVSARAGGTVLAGQLAGLTLAPGLHSTAAAVGNTGTVTLDGGGDPNAVFVFKIGGALTMAALARVTLTGGARASNVFWQVGGAAALGAGARFAGTLMASDAIGVGAGAIFNGRALSLNGAISLDANEFYSAPPTVTITGGATAITTDTTPTISGATNLEAPRAVSVEINGVTSNVTPSGGVWSMTTPPLANATYTVTVTAVDAADNRSSASQQLTVDTVLPDITIDGVSPVTTNDPTPTISGTSDVATGTTVTVEIGAQTRTALVQSDDSWNVTMSTLTDGTHTVSASVSDPAGNESTVSQELTVDTGAPTVSITGGATSLTNDATPTISGTATGAEDEFVSVHVANETLAARVSDGGGWSVTASALADGPHRIMMSVSDAAGNSAGATQMLTVDTVAPVVTIDGGQTASTTDTSPTITGTSDAAPGATVTVSIAGQTMTALVQANHSWNATATVGEGTHMVHASVNDPAGNTGSDTQTLTVATAVPEPTPTPTPSPPAPTPSPPAPTPPTATPTPATPSPTPSPPAPTPTSPPAGVPTSPAAVTTVAQSPSHKLTASALWVATKLTAPSTGSVAAGATGKVRIKGSAKTFRLRRASATIAAGESTTFKLQLKGTKATVKAALAKINRAAKNGKRVTATIDFRILDAGSDPRLVKRTVKLTP